MTDRTALSLQIEERLDLAELAEACVAAGLYAAASCRGLVVGVPDKRKRCRWKETGREHGYLLLIFRDAVRAVLPGSYCIPVPAYDARRFDTPPLRVVLADEWGHFPPKMDEAKAWDKRYRRVPNSIYGKTETECWARALVALHRAGLLGKGGVT